MRDKKLEELKDHEARSLIRYGLDQSLMVEAAAGTGKTSELVRRIVGVLREGRALPDQIVAVTFTRKAAGELKLRLREELDKARTSESEAKPAANLERAISRLEQAHIGTIHSFCAELLRERPVEAGVDPEFQELAEDEMPRLFEQAYRPWIESKLADPPAGINRLLSRSMAGEYSSASPLEQIRNAALKFLEWRDYTASWQRRPFDREREMDALIEMTATLSSMSGAASNTADELYRSLRPVRDFQEWLERSERERRRNYSLLEGFLLQLLRELKQRHHLRKGRGFFSDKFSREQVLGLREALVESLEEFQTRSGAELAALLQGELSSLFDDYAELKLRSGRLDFADLLLKARDLLRSNREVRAHFQKRFTHIFVDEFQDTDAIQAELFVLLSSNDPEEADWKRITPYPGKLFLVGDPKQSIYRFRRADVLLYEEIKERLTSRGVLLSHLTQSFRSLAPIQRLVNAAFEPEMQGKREWGQPEYVALDEYRQAEDDQPAVVVLPVPHPYGMRNLSNVAISESQPDAVGAFIDWLIRESGWRVADPGEEGRLRRISPRHIAILFRRFVSWGNDVTKPYARALEMRGVPHVLVGSRSFHEREEVETLRAALTAVEYPDDELAVYATLRGSLFALPDALLFRFRSSGNRLSPFLRVPEDVEESDLPIYDALSFLARLHKRRNRQPIVQTLNEILDFTRFHAALALRPAGHQVLANVQRVCDLARNFELAGALSFRSFVDYLEAEAERQSGGEGPVVEEGVDGVRLMTVHASKGLEFPVVVLADMTCGLASGRPDRFVDGDRNLAAFSVLGCRPWELLENEELEARRDAAEGIRIAYVAATRARDLLVIPAVGDKEREGWLTPLNKVIYPPRNQWRNAEPSPHCPGFGNTSVLSRPIDFDGLSESSVHPGLHRPLGEEVPILWWDPALLSLEASGDFGLRSRRLLTPPDETSEVPGLRELREWEEKREEKLLKGSVPEFLPWTVTGSDEVDQPPETGPIQVEQTLRDGKRPSGARFGTLVHSILRDVPLDASFEQIEDLALVLSRAADVPEEERRAAIGTVAATLKHPLIQRARAATVSHREVPVLLRLQEAQVLEGTIDLMFLEDGTFHVVDFKTDFDPGERRQRYLKQLGWYLKAVRELTGKETAGWLLSI